MTEKINDLEGLSWSGAVKHQQESVKPSAEDQNLIIIDGNNLGYRYLKRKNFNSFTDDYVRTIESLAKSYQCKDIVVAFDFGRSDYRKTLFPEYKANRDFSDQTPEEELHMKEFFQELNNVQETMQYQNFKLYGVEADDIITYLTLQLKDRYPHIWIISSDRDLYQLLDDNVSIFNLFSRKELTKQWLWDEKGLTPEQHKLSKIIQGDPGDNIKGIEGIGEKRGDDIAKTYKEIGKLISSLPLPGKSQYIKNLNNGKDILLRNEKLINLTGHIREIISHGENGPKNFEILDHFVRQRLKDYPKYEIEKVKLQKSTPVSIGSLENLIK